ncbi:hypothetical protein K788_0004500 [Paraburkholderia caribensis MBA4]|uniref:Uncharacterized protein n=1 Tax=Paraburkholderia caribensis MBA4 TaxID=1323664 RepID=A0A0P0RA38_9BURK|nr:hypothetical protein K788_0004500 [Paraburkholderia caribensis MBA4]
MWAALALAMTGKIYAPHAWRPGLFTSLFPRDFKYRNDASGMNNLN